MNPEIELRAKVNALEEDLRDVREALRRLADRCVETFVEVAYLLRDIDVDTYAKVVPRLARLAKLASELKKEFC